jgi:ribose transport system ATP-binding protein
MNTLVEVKQLTKFFLHQQALKDVDCEIYEGETLAIVGHNGAGKSTLVNILTGTYGQTSGELIIDEKIQDQTYNVHTANQQGIRAVFQELSLCPNLSVLENMRVFHPSLQGRNWKKEAEEKIMETLDIIFPGHGIHPEDIIEDLSLGKRQIVEIAKAFTSVDHPHRLVILDEPTSALDHQTSEQLISYLNSLQGKKVSCIYISHLIDEVLACSSRIMVMKDGVNIGILDTRDASRNKIIEMMGEAKPLKTGEASVIDEARKELNEDDSVIEPTAADDGVKRIKVQKGEIIGLTGLAGHGQTDLLLNLFNWRRNKEYSIEGPVTFLPGDRQADGIFPRWSIVKNLTLQVYNKLRKMLLIDTRKETRAAEKWKKIIDIKSGSLAANILSLSGGNQQKVLFARCLESSSPIVLMDDPTRGVDVGTKEEIYKLILHESAKGRSFVWYTTEMDELKYCDRIYVFKSGKILAELAGSEATEEEILKSSF